MAKGEQLPFYECDILVRFDGVDFDDFDPFFDASAWDTYVERFNTVVPTGDTAVLSFELSCKSNPDAFYIQLDDVHLNRVCPNGGDDEAVEEQ